MYGIYSVSNVSDENEYRKSTSLATIQTHECVTKTHGRIKFSVNRRPDGDRVLCVYRKHTQHCYIQVTTEQVTFNAYSHLTHNIH